MVEGAGQSAGRGEIAEFFSPQADNPVRVTFFDDEIESIRFFEAESQRSFGAPLASFDVGAAIETRLSGEQKSRLEAYLQRAQGERNRRAAQRNLYELEEAGTFPAIEAFAREYGAQETVLSWVSQPLVVCDELCRIAAETERRENDRAKLFSEVLLADGAFGCENDCRFSLEETLAGAALCDFSGIAPFGKPKLSLEAGGAQTVGFAGNFELLTKSVRERLASGWQVYLFAGGRAPALCRSLEQAGLLLPVSGGEPAAEGAGAVVAGRVFAGFELREQKAYFASEEEIFGSVRKPRREKKAPSRVLDPLSELSPGDFVVHEVHGKGRYLGIKTMEAGGTRADYLEIEYRDGDKLYIQTAQIARVQKYIGPGDDDTKLSKLGGKEWEGAKSRARASVKALAENLAELYEERANRQGFAFSPDSIWQNQFEENFAYEETPGQLESIRQIKRDMESGKVMDRLLLGDVGYGKTEVAMRACMKAVLDSKQVAVLVPTTLLARQHEATFRERFAGFPVKIASLSRFTKDPKAVLSALETGGIDIVIGTHKLLSKSVKYKNLGLLIVDEEQRFGVSHKERIKDMRRDVDVLTLTATPIPRTLEMAMSGMRDMSTIDTPPEDRHEVAAYVVEFSWGLVAEAIRRELLRGGQAYFVCRRISQMEELARGLAAAVPEARVVTAHGQMSESAFERAVGAFYEHEFDVLLSTTIIESGIDIPSVNTIILYEADQFGLAQLYQLKGRVGRSSVRAYAYFTHLGAGRIGEAAGKRLEAIREFTQFGSGFRIAMRDLEIRGAGNILGPEQSGHMAQVGYHLYCKLMREGVDEAMGRPAPPPERDVAVELSKDAYLPESYVSCEAQKIDIYRMVAEIVSPEEARRVREALAERFGAPPKEVLRLVAAGLVRHYAARAGLGSVIRKGGELELKFAENVSVSLPKLSGLLKLYPASTLRRTTPPALLLPAQSLQGLLRLLSQIRSCIDPANRV